MDRTALRQLCWDLLGVKSTDPFFTVSRVDGALNIAEHQLGEEVRRQKPSRFRTIVTLAADSASGNSYTFATQAAPITDFHEVLELRVTDSRGCVLSEVDDDNLDAILGPVYSIIGTDKAPIITTGQSVAAGAALYLKYARKTAAWSGATDSPESVPDDFHDVIGLVALPLLFAQGGESAVPRDIAIVTIDRRGALWHHMGLSSQDPHLVEGGTSTQGLVETVRR